MKAFNLGGQFSSDHDNRILKIGLIIFLIAVLAVTVYDTANAKSRFTDDFNDFYGTDGSDEGTTLGSCITQLVRTIKPTKRKPNGMIATITRTDNTVNKCQSCIHFAGRLASQTRTAEGLQAFLHGYFRIGVRVDEFIGQWVPLPEDSRCRLGFSPATGTLGHTAIAGERIWDRGQKFRVALGPMQLGMYRELLPGGEGLRELAELNEGVPSYGHRPGH